MSYVSWLQSPDHSPEDMIRLVDTNDATLDNRPEVVRKMVHHEEQHRDEDIRNGKDFEKGKVEDKVRLRKIRYDSVHMILS